MNAAPRPSIATSDDAATDVATLLERPEDARTLIATLADGRPHPFAELARLVHGRADAAHEDRVAAALDALHELGMPLARTGRVVAARGFEPLDERALQRALPGWTVSVVGSAASTSDALLAHVRAGGPDEPPMLLATDVQLAGRGRLGRRWTAAPGASLAVSFALRVARPIAALDGVTLVCGLAVRDAVVDAGVAARLKWPNDVVVGDRKLGGILVEAHAGGAATAIVVGVGLNVSQRGGAANAPVGLAPVDLAACGATAIDRHRIVARIARSLQARLAAFASAGFAPFVDEWNDANAFRDRAVTLRSTAHAEPAAARTGVDRGVDARGALRFDVDGVVERVISGDVSLRPAAG